ncbi:MAG: hypothetical protein HYR96_07250 [Deltaproteobacteria bacterium]|nr:hypothetical protein [Deltaproteobacteria bacterium]MBI3295137.1 hypothetical protein [Deltaproteobacteria bacterium]
MRTILAGLLLLLLLPACSSSVTSKNSSSTMACAGLSPSKILQNYLLEYNGTDDSAYGEAVFRYQNPLGPAVQVDSPCGVTTDSFTLNLRNFDFARYVARGTGVKPSLAFTFTDANSATHTNSVTLATIAFNPDPPAALSLAATSTTVTFTATPALSSDLTDYNDLVVLELTDTKSAPRIYVALHPKTSTTFVIKNDQTTATGFHNLFAQGTQLCMRLLREYRSNLASTGDTGAGGVSISRYYTDYKCANVTA